MKGGMKDTARREKEGERKAERDKQTDSVDGKRKCGGKRKLRHDYEEHKKIRWPWRRW